MTKYAFGLTFLTFLIAAAASAQDTRGIQVVQSDVKLYGGPGTNFGAIGTAQANEPLVIVGPQSVTIGNGVNIGQGGLIEGKPWFQVRTQSGIKGYLSGSHICTTGKAMEGIAGQCGITVRAGPKQSDQKD